VFVSKDVSRRTIRKKSEYARSVFLGGLHLSDALKELKDVGQKLVSECGEGELFVSDRTCYDEGIANLEVVLTVVTSRQETDKEFDKRMLRQAKTKEKRAIEAARREEKERKEYERLQKKFSDR
jgi:hypothetical protein